MQTNKTRATTMNWLPIWLQGWKTFWVLSAGLYTIVYSAWIIYKWTNPDYEILIANLGYLPLGFFSAVGAIYAARQKQLDQNTRRGWQFIAISIISLVLADIIYTVLELTRGINFPDIPDFFYLAFYPLAFIGLRMIPARLSDPTQEKTWKLDLLTIITGITSILWFFVIAPTANAGGEDWFTKLVAGAYPAMDMLLIASIASLIFHKSDINTRQAMFILGIGIGVYVVADIIYAWQILQDEYLSGSSTDILYTLSYLFIGLAALRQASPYLAETDTKTRKVSIIWQNYIIPLIVVVASLLTSLFSAINGEAEAIQSYGLYIGTTVTILITIAREAILTRENIQLIEKLSFATEQMQASADVLEVRISERTRELEDQTKKLHLVAQIARDIASATDLDSLLERSSALILERFNIYHTGIFILDSNKEYAVLTASPTEPGKQMIAAGHKLRVGEVGIVGRVASTGEPHIALDTGLDAIHFNNPYLPKTRSEMALPLKAELKIIGVLDVQSNYPQAFNADDIAIMQVLADQLATAMERTQLLQQVEKNLRELEQAYGRSTKENWRSFAESELIKESGYLFDNVRIQSIREATPQGYEAMQTGNTILQNADGHTNHPTLIAIPIKIRGQAIGSVTVKLKDGYSPNTINTLEQAIERLSGSLESARLFEEARLRADREQTIAQVTANITSATDFDSILRATVEEVGKSLGDSEVSIQIMESPE